jgi:hypothetical protein
MGARGIDRPAAADRNDAEQASHQSSWHDAEIVRKGAVHRRRHHTAAPNRHDADREQCFDQQEGDLICRPGGVLVDTKHEEDPQAIRSFGTLIEVRFPADSPLEGD